MADTLIRRSRKRKDQSINRPMRTARPVVDDSTAAKAIARHLWIAIRRVVKEEVLRCEGRSHHKELFSNFLLKVDLGSEHACPKRYACCFPVLKS